jgi:excisionase family DNA binding protein
MRFAGHTLPLEVSNLAISLLRKVRLTDYSEKMSQLQKKSADYLGRTVDALREIIWAGKLPYVRDGRRVFIDIRDMEDYVEQNKTSYSY